MLVKFTKTFSYSQVDCNKYKKYNELPIKVYEVTDSKQLHQFIHLPAAIHKNHVNWEGIKWKAEVQINFNFKVPSI